jgi:hypothetical protein
MTALQQSGSRASTAVFDRYNAAMDRVFWLLVKWIRPAPRYIRLLGRIHRELYPRTYIEIGTAKGTSMAVTLPETVAIGVDPDPHVVFGLSRRTQIVHSKSDDFFHQASLPEILGGADLELAFIDGMHHFEYALRDFINIERNGTPQTTVLVHDCYPVNERTADRTRYEAFWSGDVWRMILCLREQRPDLNVSVIDVAPTGLGVISRLDPSSRVLTDRFDELVEEYMGRPYSSIENGKKAELLNRVPDDWATVRGLLPKRTVEPTRLAMGLTARAARQVVPAARLMAQREWARLRGGDSGVSSGRPPGAQSDSARTTGASRAN